MSLRSVVVVFLLAVGASGCVVRSAVRRADLPPGGREVRALAYYEGEGFDDQKHRLNLYAPKGPGPHPVVVFVHGGGWVLGDRDQFLAPYVKLGRRLASMGVVAVVISYRLAPEFKHPAHVEDVSRAIAWTFANVAAYGGDPSRIFAMGHSAGAHLVSLAATDPRWLGKHGLTPSRLKGVIAVSGPYDVHNLGAATLFGGLAMIHPAFGKDHDTWRDVTPMNHVGEAPAPPFLLAYGDGDPELLRRHAVKFKAELERHKVPVTLHVTSLDDHFSIITDFADAENTLGEEARAFIFGPGEPPAAVAREIP